MSDESSQSTGWGTGIELSEPIMIARLDKSNSATSVFSPLLYRLSYLARSLEYCLKDRGSHDWHYDLRFSSARFSMKSTT
jgi:hypothetical protein